jgi:hypothetical protein
MIVLCLLILALVVFGLANPAVIQILPVMAKQNVGMEEYIHLKIAVRVKRVVVKIYQDGMQVGAIVLHMQLSSTGSNTKLPNFVFEVSVLTAVVSFVSWADNGIKTNVAIQYTVKNKPLILCVNDDINSSLILFDPETKQVLGVGIVGPGAGDMISEGMLAIEMGADAEDIGLTVHPHPTLSETVGLAAEAFTGTITDLYLQNK